MAHTQKTDILIIGSGAAGLTLALEIAEHARVTVLSKLGLADGCTNYAQGGIAAVMSDEDSLTAHKNDTINAGAGLCNSKVVKHTTRLGPQAIESLIKHGVPFTRSDDGFHLTREGGHTFRRVLHAADATGQAIQTTLLQRAQTHPNITLKEHAIAIDLITTENNEKGKKSRVTGCYYLDKKQDHVEAISARFVVLATGGASKVYLYTSNPDVSTGDGIAMAWRAGCRIANMEFNQFHPTCLFHPDAKTFLITEAIRGEGGHLQLPNGERFMQRFDKRGELAPRDIVARAIDHEMKRLGTECLYLDISHKPAEFIKSHFPTVYARCLEYGIDITKEPIPVVPAAHYTCGGVVTNTKGETDIKNLYAIGEVAFTGLHGANRMASNSLLECVVFGQASAHSIISKLEKSDLPKKLKSWDESRVTNSDEEVVVSHNWEELRRFMWDYVGIVRTNKRLQRAKRRVDLLRSEIEEYYGNFRVSNDLIELRNLVDVADLIIRSAMARKESRGLHYTLDYPDIDDLKPPQDTVLTPDNFYY